MKNLFRRSKSSTSSSPTLESLTKQNTFMQHGDEAEGSNTSGTTGRTSVSIPGLTARGDVKEEGEQRNIERDGIERYGFHSTCLQIKDPKRSIKFYEDMFGMEVVKATESDDFSMYFLGFRLSDSEEKGFGSRVGLLQLVHVHGSEDDDTFAIKTGHPGFSHFSISVPDVDKARNRLESLGVEVIEDGTNARGFAAVADPDGYHIQLIAQNLGQDDQLRAEVEKLMSESATEFSLTLPSTGKAPSDALRFAKGGSPVSPLSPS